MSSSEDNKGNEKLLKGYEKHVLKWRKRAVEAEVLCDTLRKRNLALERIIYEAGL